MWKTYRRYLGLPVEPVEWIDRHLVSDTAPGADPPEPEALDFASLRSRIGDLAPRGQLLTPGNGPFPGRYAQRASMLIFNIADYGQALLSDFRAAGGRRVRREFNHPAELASLPERW